MKMKYLLFCAVALGSLGFSSHTALSQRETPLVDYDRKVIFNDSPAQPSPLRPPYIYEPPPPFVYQSPYKRLLGQTEQSISQILFNRKNYEVFISEPSNKSKLINFTSKDTLFDRGIYIVKQGRIIGYAFAEQLALFQQKNPPFLADISQIPIVPNFFSYYAKTPKYGRLEFRQKDHGDYLEQYIFYFAPDTQYGSGGNPELLLDSFFPKSEQKRLEKPIGRALARFVRAYDQYYTQFFGKPKLSPNDLDFDPQQKIDPEMEYE